MTSMILTNAQIVTRDDEFLGTVVVENGVIQSVETGLSSLSAAIDLDGDYLLPGFVELHTDNMEKHFTPRPGVKWPSVPAAIAHDVQIIGAGITTVFDALSVGAIIEKSARLEQLSEMFETIEEINGKGHFRADHHIHLRCELSFEGVVDLFEPFVGHDVLQMVSLMDHAPGQRQFVNIDKYRQYYQGKHGFSDQEMDEFIAQHVERSAKFSDRNRKAVVALAKAHDLPLASHDDATQAHVDEAVENGVCLSEFPTTMEAAKAGRDAGMHILMGAPNMVRGLSHSGNISARSLAEEGAMDILSSDYFPGSILQGIFAMHHNVEGITLPEAVRSASLNPADAANMHDRGEIAEGKRADLVQVRMDDAMPIAHQVWVQGNRAY